MSGRDPARGAPGGHAAGAAVRPDVRHRVRHRRHPSSPTCSPRTTSAPGWLAFAFATFAICWAWINFSWFASAYDTDDWIYRLMTMLQMVGVIILALGLPAMYASIEHGGHVDNRVMVAGYVVMRIALVAQWLRAAKQDPAATLGVPDLRHRRHRRADRLDRDASSLQHVDRRDVRVVGAVGRRSRCSGRGWPSGAWAALRGTPTTSPNAMAC